MKFILYKSAFRSALIILILINSYFSFKKEKSKKSKRLRSFRKKFKENNNIDSSQIVDMNIDDGVFEPNKGNWDITWNIRSNSITSNSWIGCYYYGMKHDFENHLSKIQIKSKTNGEGRLIIPKEAGIYDIRYIMDNNLKAISTSKYYIVTPREIIITVKTSTELNEIITVEWSIQENFISVDSDLYLCLNIVGSYDKCILKKKLNELESNTTLKMPKFAGYYIIRIVSNISDQTKENQYFTYAISGIIKSNSSSINLKSNNVKTVVASVISTKWEVEEGGENPSDWIGLFYLSDTKAFLQSEAPIRSLETKGTLKGTFDTSLPPNSQAGPFIFVYYKNHIPVAVSDIIEAQQPETKCLDNKKTMSKIKHLIIICTENHSFDSYFGSYCTAETGSNPSCNHGRKCCEKVPDKVDGHSPFLLDDEQNKKFDPDHSRKCELCEINGGKMDGFIKGCYCSNPNNFAVADPVFTLHDYAKQYALADRYFQPAAGASSQNDMYFARASHVFIDNNKFPVGSVGSNCHYFQHRIPSEIELYYDPTIVEILASCGFTLKTYAEGFEIASKDYKGNKCYPYGYDVGDIPFQYFAGVTDNPRYINDYKYFAEDIENGKLPDVSFIKPIGYKTAHPGVGDITSEQNFIRETVDLIMNSKYAEDTLIIWVPDESGGYYDHVSPPKTSKIDNFPYGPRIPAMAIGKFAKKNYISHKIMEHSSIVKFIEWNWLGGETGQLNTRDKVVNSIGDLIDSEKAGLIIP